MKTAEELISEIIRSYIHDAPDKFWDICMKAVKSYDENKPKPKEKPYHFLIGMP